MANRPLGGRAVSWRAGGRRLRAKPDASVATVTEGLVVRTTAAAEPNVLRSQNGAAGAAADLEIAHH